MDPNPIAPQPEGVQPQPVQQPIPVSGLGATVVNFNPQQNTVSGPFIQPMVGSMSPVPAKSPRRLPFSGAYNNAAIGLGLGLVALFISLWIRLFGILDSQWLGYTLIFSVTALALIVSYRAFNKHQNGLGVIGLVISTVVLYGVLTEVSIQAYLHFESKEAESSLKQNANEEILNEFDDPLDTAGQSELLEDTNPEPDSEL